MDSCKNNLSIDLYEQELLDAIREKEGRDLVNYIKNNVLNESINKYIEAFKNHEDLTWYTNDIYNFVINWVYYTKEEYIDDLRIVPHLDTEIDMPYSFILDTKYDEVFYVFSIVNKTLYKNENKRLTPLYDYI